MSLPLGLADLTREGARDAAREELSRREYADAQPPLLLRLVGRAIGALLELIDDAAAAVPGGRVGLLLLLGLLVLLVAVVLARVRPVSGRGARPAVFTGSAVLSAAEHRVLAESAAAEGRFADAVRERLRAVVRDLEARAVLDARPGRTAGEIAWEGGAAVPAIAEDLRRAALTFDEIWYGGRPAERSSYSLLVEVDERVSRTPMVTA